MHRQLTRRARAALRARRRRDERGVAAIMIAISLLALIISSAFVLDFGLVRVDRQVNKSAADSAAMAGAHGLYAGNANAYGYAGVCTAIRYLQNSDNRFAGVTAGSGTWTDGGGTPVAAGSACTSDTYLKKACVSTDLSTWAKFSWTGTYQSNTISVKVQSGYVIGGYAEDTLASAAADASDGKGGCDQLAVFVTENRKPGFGSLARTADLVSTIRSVARTAARPTGDAPAMLLLKQSGCPTVEVGSTGGGSWIKVFGAISTDGTRTQAGTIHSDADGSSCGTSVYYGKANDGIIAYAAPKIGAPTTPDTTRPGQITSYAAKLGLTSVDGASKVYGSTLLTGSGGTVAAGGRDRVTRSVVDARYLAGVKNAINGAQSGVFGLLTPANAVANGFTKVTCSSGNAGAVPAGTVKLFVDCSDTKSITVPSTTTTVVFNGSVSPSGTINIPNAQKVYLFGATDAINLGNGTEFSMNTQNIDSATGNCRDGQSTNRAVLFVKNGGIKETGGLLRMCNTTVYMMGNTATGCVPTYTPTVGDEVGPAPTTTPCSSAAGNGQITTTGGGVDWTAPNKWDKILDDSGIPDSLKAVDWASVDGPEDLALWDESYGASSNPKYQFTGGGTFHLQGLFMVPNADPISLSGNANFVLKNAQFVSTSLSLASNNTTLSMTVDPNAGIALPKLAPVGLVR